MEDFNNALASFGNTQSSAQSYIAGRRDKFFKDYQDRLGTAAQAQAEALGLDQETQEKLTKAIEATGVAAPIVFASGKKLVGFTAKKYAARAANQVASVTSKATGAGAEEGGSATAAASGSAEEGGSAVAAASGGAAEEGGSAVAAASGSAVDAAPVAAGNLSSALASGGAAEGGAAGAAAEGAETAATAATTTATTTTAATEGASGLAEVGGIGATAEGIAPWATEVIAPAVALAGVGYAIWDLFHPHHSHEQTAPPATFITGHATGISDSITRGGFATAGIDSVTSLPAQNSAF
tara:strand:+ start:1795 stop:2682 length:888 start_codon:yes stop_codon:yes gene_type:complete